MSFLSSQGVDWRDATEGHLLDFEYWRRRDERNPRRVGGAKFARELTACRRFYEWQEKRSVISRSPVEAATLRPSNRRSVRMKWLTPAAYREWCNVGLAGYRGDDSYDESWRGRNASRNLAFAETLWSSGLRLREAATLLIGELPSSESSRYPSARLAEAVAKGQGRDYWISRQALTAIRTYRKWSRAGAVRRAQEQGRYGDVPGIMIQMSVTKNRQMIYRDQHSSDKKMVSLDSLHADERRRVFVEGDDGLEPAMVWLTEAGLPMPHTTWQKVFQVANARCEAQGLPDRSCHPHALRHSFALRWLCVFMWAHDRRFGLTPQESDELRRTYGDPYAMVSQLLGHSSRETTEQWSSPRWPDTSTKRAFDVREWTQRVGKESCWEGNEQEESSRMSSNVTRWRSSAAQVNRSARSPTSWVSMTRLWATGYVRMGSTEVSGKV